MMRTLKRVALAGAVLAAMGTLTSTVALAQNQLDPMVLMLQRKGVLDANDVAALQALSPAQQREQLIQILQRKGIFTPEESSSLSAAAITRTAPPTVVAAPATSYFAIGRNPFAILPDDAMLPAAVPPLRTEPIGRPELNGLTDGWGLGHGISLQPYGVLVATYSHDTSSPYGHEFPLPAFNPITNGPNRLPEQHVNAANSIIGANVAWATPSSALSAFGSVELDFNGSFPVNTVSNQTAGAYQPRVRRAVGRVDYCANQCAAPFATDAFFLAGLEWTPFASSTQPVLLEQTLSGAGFGNISARLPQIRIGIDQKLGNNTRGLHIAPEFAIVQPVSGSTPADLTVQSGPLAGTPVANNEGVTDQLGFGERQGSDSNTPQFQARLVTQFQLDEAEGVAPAQFIVSAMKGNERAVALANQVPAAFSGFFPAGVIKDRQTSGGTLEVQLPTRWATLSGKYYAGEDLRFYGGGQFFNAYNNTTGLTNTATGQSIDGASTLVYGLRNGVAVVADQTSIPSQGGFVQLGLPISRWFGADPQGWNAGWTVLLTYGADRVARQQAQKEGGGREQSRMYALGLRYQPRPFLTLAVDVSLFHTKAIPLTATGLPPAFDGAPQQDWWDQRTEFGAIFAF